MRSPRPTHHQLHWVLDVVFDEDAARNRKGHGPQNLALLRKIALKMLRSHPDKASIRTALAGWPGGYIAAEGHFMEGDAEKRAAIFIGPEFGTVARADLTAAAREALDARFDALIACGFNFDAHTSEFIKLGPLPILKVNTTR